MRRFVFFMGFLALVLDFYVFQGIKRLTANWRSARLQKAVRWGYWIFFVAFNLCFMLVLYLRFSTDQPFTNLMKWVMNLFLTFFVTKLVFVLVMFAEDIARAGVLIYRIIRSTLDRKSTRLNSSHSQISYAVFCLKK